LAAQDPPDDSASSPQGPKPEQPAAVPEPSPTPAASAVPAASPAPAAPASRGAPSPLPSPSASPVPPGEEKLAPGEIRIKAETQGGDPSHHWARGFVDLRAGDIRIQGDAADMYEVQKPDGGKKQEAVFVGNVVFLREDERLAGERLTMDLETGKGMFDHARGYVQPGVFVEADSIERIDGDHYRIKGGTFTACTQPDPRWNFSASSAKVHVDDKVVARNVVFRVKSVPSFYMPVFVYPISPDQRASGFLFPHFGTSSQKGFTVGEAFFWAMGRSFDQTFYADHYSKFGWGYGHEFRYMLDSPSNGSFRTYGFRPPGGGKWDYDVNWHALQLFPFKVRASVNARWYSNTAFQQLFQDTLNLASSRTQRAQVNLQRSFSEFTVSLSAEDNRVFYSDQTRINRRGPALRLNRSPKKIGNSNVVIGFETRYEALTKGSDTKLDRYNRFHFSPELSYPIATTFLELNPSVAYDYTSYTRSRDPDTLAATAPGLSRNYFETGLEITGPTFSHVFNNPSGFYSDKFKHTIGPEIDWSYRTAIDNFNAIPKFDGIDQELGTNQVDYALVQRLLAKRPGAGGKPQTWEVLSWRVGQTYYVQINNAQNEFDPNYSSSAFGPGGLPDHNSPLQSQLRIRPTPALAGTFNFEYDVNFKELRTLGFSLNLSGRVGALTANWSRARKLAELASDRILTRDFVRGTAAWHVLPDRLTLDGGVDYDMLNKNVVQSRERVRWDVQCCGFVLQGIQYNFNSRKDHQIRFSVELAGIGNIGSFLGENPVSSRGGFGGPGVGP
jgi:lipopolysaccharide assembly outer membrane protein LptD (OstA)